MVNYHPLPCVLSQHQARKLLSGGAVALKKGNTGHGEHTIHLTAQQHARLMKGNGIRLRFSGVQASHNRKHGKGFAHIADVVKSGIKASARKGVDLAAGYAKNRAGDAARTALGVVPLVGPVVGRLAEKGIHKGVEIAANAIKNKVIGKGVKKPRAPRAKTGKGFFGSLGNAIGSAASGIGQGADYVGNRIIGSGLYPPGYGGGLLPKPIRGVNSNSAGI